MNSGKYIITESLEPLLFPASLTHSTVYDHAVSAGFFKIYKEPETDGILVSCWGESSSLETQSHPVRDEWIITHFLKNCV